jgi:hypothetical protein
MFHPAMGENAKKLYGQKNLHAFLEQGNPMKIGIRKLIM